MSSGDLVLMFVPILARCNGTVIHMSDIFHSVFSDGSDDRCGDRVGNSGGECYCVDGVILMKGERL